MGHRKSYDQGRKGVHTLALCVGGVSLLFIYFISDPTLLIFSMIGLGLAWASVLTMPYAILAGPLPPAKMGIHMGIFNFFIVIPQIIASALLGWVARAFFDSQAIYVIMLGGVSMIVAGLLVTIVKDVDDAATTP